MKETSYAYFGGIRYKVDIADNQVIFTNRELFYTQLSFERPKGINNSPGIWYLTSWESDTGSIPANHIVEALKYCEVNFGKSFEKYKGELAA
jgi:hypothetical protein